MVALQAGCTQRPPAGMLIGLDGTIFSKVPVNITYPGDDHEQKRNGLSKGGIIGISVSAAVFVLMLSAALFVCYRKKIDGRRTKKLKSPLDPRFGAHNITSPNTGAYGNPYTVPAGKESPPFDVSSLSVKERQVLGLQQSVGPGHISTQSNPHPKTWESTTLPSNSHLPPYSPPGMPTHQAYIPNFPAMAPESPVTSIASSGTYQISPYPSPKTSPTHIPESTPSTGYHHGASKSPPQSVAFPSPPSQTPYTSPRTLSPPPSAQTPSIRTRIESRSNSRASARRVITKFTGTGGVNTSKNVSTPVEISAPIINYGPRFEYELREQQESDYYGRRKVPETPNKIQTPQSAESQEQWPGSY